MNLKVSLEALLLLGAVGVEVLCVIGILVVRDPFDRLHFLGPASLLGPVLVAAAIVMEEALNTNGVKTVLTVALVLLTSPMLSHATARAARVRQFGHWQALPEEQVDPD